MIDVAIAAVPNQELTIQLEGIIYDIALREANGIMTASITRDGTAVARNTLAVAGTPLLPYRYQEAGNFIMTTDGEAIPYWDQFGVTQFLVYLSAAELAAYRGA